LRNRGGTWLGWPGTSEEIPRLRTAVARASRDLGCTFVPITISRSEYEQYYLGYSNESIWPLFHDLPSQCRFDPPYWQAYGEVNRRFAEQTARIASPDDFIWVHDYQLMMVGAELRRLGRFQTARAPEDAPAPWVPEVSAPRSHPSQHAGVDQTAELVGHLPG